MKHDRKFKILKDLPDLDAGSVGVLNNGNVDFRSELIFTKKDNGRLRYVTYPLYFVEAKKDWFVEVFEEATISGFLAMVKSSADEFFEGIPIEEPYVCISPTIGKIYRFSASITLNPFIIGRLIGFDNGMFVVKKHGKVGETCRMEYCDIERGELTQVDNIEEDKKLERINIDELAFGNNIKKERIKEEHLKGTLLYLQSNMNKIIDKINKGEK